MADPVFFYLWIKTNTSKTRGQVRSSDDKGTKIGQMWASIHHSDCDFIDKLHSDISNSGYYSSRKLNGIATYWLYLQDMQNLLGCLYGNNLYRAIQILPQQEKIVIKNRRKNLQQIQ